MRITSLAIALTLFPALASAQSVIPSGAFTSGHTIRCLNATCTVVGDAGGAAGSTQQGQRYLTELGITNTGTPLCINDALTNAVGGYHRLCFGASSLDGALISYGAFGGAASLPFRISINGTAYELPATGAGTGNVVGPVSSTIGEVASFNATGGTALRQGAATLTDNKTTALLVDGAALKVSSQSSSVDALYIWRCAVSATCTTTVSPGNYDAVRGVAVSPATQVVSLVNGVAGYLMNSTPRASPYPGFPVATAINGVGICDADGCGTWGINTIVTDNRGQTISAHGPRFIFGGEFDVQAMSTETRVFGVLTGGTSLVQPYSADAFNCLYLDGSAAAGKVAKWSGCYESQNGAATRFAVIGSIESDLTFNNNKNSQILEFHFWSDEATPALKNLQISATPGGLFFATTGVATSASISLPAGAVYNVGNGGGYRIADKAIAAGTVPALNLGTVTDWTTVNLGNASATTTIFGSTVKISGLGATPGGKSTVCIDIVTGTLYSTAGAC